MLKINKESNELIEAFVLRQTDEKADQLLVDMVTHEMRRRLADKRNEGSTGWFGPNCKNAELHIRLTDCLSKNKMVDAINYAAMILARQKLYGETA